MTTSSRQWGPLLQVATVAAMLFLPGSATAREDEIEPTAPAPAGGGRGKNRHGHSA